MIIYEPNKHILGDIIHLAKSWTMVKLLRAVILIGIFTAILSFCVDHFSLKAAIPAKIGTIFSFLGVVLSILLVFRTNSAYDRWWEGRKQWGALVNNCRNLAIVAHTTLPKKDYATRHQLAVFISNFCFAFTEHLRKGVKLELLIQVSEEDMTEYKERVHLPNYISYQIQQLVIDACKRGDISEIDQLNYKPHTQSLLDILGACERIKKTPIPFSYEVFIKIFIFVYSFLLPIALTPMFGYITIPIVMLVFFAFLGLELLAAEIEDPFGLDCNDLPTGTISHTISDNVFEILEPTHHKDPEPKLYEKVF